GRGSVDAGGRLERIRGALRRVTGGEPSPADMAHHKEAYFDALADDLNTPAALAALFAWVREANRRAGGVGDADLREMLSVLGLGGLAPLKGVGDLAAIDPEASSLLRRWGAGREQGDFTAADSLREQLRARGWEVRDGPDGSELIPAPQP